MRGGQVLARSSRRRRQSQRPDLRGAGRGASDQGRQARAPTSARQKVVRSLSGRGGKKPVGCEETEYCLRLRQRFGSARLVFDPDLDVFHRVSPDQRAFK